MMNDLISRQAAYDTLTEYYHHTTEIQHKALREALERVPSAEPEKRTEERTETHACDCIERQAAIKEIKAIFEWHDTVTVERMIEHFNNLPSAQPEVLACGEGELIAQPEIIRCNDCKHWTQTTGNMRGFGLGDCDYINAKLVNCNGFCYWAERRG